jgi:3-phytase
MNLLATLLLLAQVDVTPLRETASETHQTDDPAIWVHPRRPEQSLILGTIKMAAPDGAIAVYRLDGSRLMSIPNVDRPNNIDVAYGFRLGRRKLDIAAATERNQHRLRLFEILPGKGLRDLAALPVFAGQTGQAQQPMGIALYTRPRDGALFAIVSRKSGPSGSYLWQYRLRDDGRGQLIGEKVREFGQFSGAKEIEAIVVDAELGYVYYSDEGTGIRKYHADPDHPEAAQELALFGTEGWEGDREGLAIYARPGGKGYLIATDQRTPNSVYHVYRRETDAGQAHEKLGSFQVGAATTDGIEVTARPLGRAMPGGLFIAMNDSRRNFLLVDWREIAAALRLRED